MYSKEDLLYRTILIVTLIIGIIIIGFLLSVITQQRKWRKLNLKKIEREIDTLENERERFAADLHDEIGAGLTAMKFKLESIDTASDDDQVQVFQCVHLVHDLVDRIRLITNALMPATLMNNGITAAITEYARLVNVDSKLSIAFESIGTAEVPPSCSLHIFRILQEIIHNTIKHAKASVLRIELFMETDQLIILTADNGQGFDYDNTIKKKKGLGLSNLQNRTDYLGGAFHLTSTKGKGTRCHIVVPL